MEIAVTNQSLNGGISRAAPVAKEEQKLNAYGIGEANRPTVELSAQARILQQTEQNQEQRRAQAQRTEGEERDTSQEFSNEFVRVSSSVGQSSQANNLTTEKATELYRSIEKML